MQKKYDDLIRHIPFLEDHGHLYMYYGVPYSDECLVYSDENEDGNLILSHECDDLLTAIVKHFEEGYEWLDILEEHGIELEKVFSVDVENQDFDVIASLLLYMAVSVTLEDRLIDALNNGYVVRLLKRLAFWN
jgi:hypothetical protein